MLPHILIRFYTVPTAKDARTSVNWAITLIGAFYLMTLVLGFGAAALLNVGPERYVALSGGNLASPLLAEEVGGGAGTNGGAILLAFIAAVAFATILAVVAGLTLTSASSVAHDLYANVVKKGTASEKDEVKVARIAAFAIGGVAIVLSIFAQDLNIAFLVALAFAVAASANLPALVMNLFWKRFNTRGGTWVMLRGPHHLRRPGVLLTDGVRSDRCLLDLGRLLVVSVGQPGHHLDPGRLPVRHPRNAHLA